MTTKRSSKLSFKFAATLGMVLMMAFFSACDILATEGARDAIANGREIREFENENIRPLENQMNDLWVNEIEPRERELEDLRHEMQVMEEEVLRPLWDSQNDIWAPGGEASVAQAAFDSRYRELDVLQKEIDVAQRDLDTRWQTLWAAPEVDPEYQTLEDLRYEKQRELDRLYRFGNRPIDEIWDQINELNAAQGWANTDSQIESEQINTELRRLWDLQEELQNSSNDQANHFYDQANNTQNELNDLYNFGWDPINEIYAEIERLEAERGFTSTTIDSESIRIQIIDLENLRASYEANRDSEVAVLQAKLDALGTVTTSGFSAETVARITDLKALIADLEDEAAAIVAAKETEKDTLSAQIDAIKASYDQLVEDAEQAFLVVSAGLLADAEVIDDQIDALKADDEVANADQIATLQTQYDAIVAEEQAEEDVLDVLVDGYNTDEDAELVAPKALKDAVELELASGDLTADIDAQVAVYDAELELLLNGFDAAGNPVSTTVSDVDSTEADAIRASIDAAKNEWNVLIAELTNKILILESQVGTSSVDNEIDARINSLKLQAAEAEQALYDQIEKLELLVNELYRQAETANSGDSARYDEIQREIDFYNEQLEAIWQRDSASGLEVLLKVQVLEKQVRVMQEELEQQIYRLEEELWDLDDQLNRFYKDQNDTNQLKEAEFQAEGAALQLRRTEIEEMRWALDDEQQAFYNSMDEKQRASNEEIKLIEQEQFGALREQMRALEEEIRTFYNQQREIEAQIREARILVEQKERELEDKVFDALESAAGTVDEAGDTVLTATEESIPPTAIPVVPDVDEGVTAPTGTAN